MSEIKREYYKEYRLSVIIVWVWAIIMCLCVLNPNKSKPAAVLCAVCGAVVLYALALTIVTLFAPLLFKKKLNKLNESEKDEVLNGKFTKIGLRRFYEHYLMYYSSRNIQLVKFSDIESIEPKGNKIKLMLKNGKKSAVFVANGENSAMLAAAIKSKNPEIAVTINGKVIKNNEISEEKEKRE